MQWFCSLGLSKHMSEGSVVLSGIQTQCKSVIKVTSDDAEEEDEEMEDDDETEEDVKTTGTNSDAEEEDGDMDSEQKT